MSRYVTLVFAALLVAGVPAGEPARLPDGGDLDWISGHWCAASGDEIVEEIWLPPHGGLALGLSRTRNGPETAAFEYLRIVRLDGVLSYVAQPGGRRPAAFARTASGENWMRFENAEHDFPQRIEYRREGDALHAEISGPGEDGTELVIPFAYRRCAQGISINEGNSGTSIDQGDSGTSIDQ